MLTCAQSCYVKGIVCIVHLVYIWKVKSDVHYIACDTQTKTCLCVRFLFLFKMF